MICKDCRKNAHDDCEARDKTWCDCAHDPNGARSE